jgi:hypothetical protein
MDCVALLVGILLAIASPVFAADPAANRPAGPPAPTATFVTMAAYGKGWRRGRQCREQHPTR